MNDVDLSDVERETVVGKRPSHVPHYYGDNVRRLFFAIAIITVFTLPFFKDFIHFPVIYYIVAMIFLSLIAGFTNPLHRWVGVLNVVISIYGIYFFESEAISAYKVYSTEIWYFWTNQLLAFLFLTALYYAAKTERGKWFRRRFNSNKNR